MTHGRKYDASGLVEAQYEPGSHGRVLKNLLGIRTRREMVRVEAAAQFDVYLDFVLEIDKRHRFTVADICAMHRKWLGSIYPWAGRYRQVNLTKDRFPFATADHVPRMMKELEQGPLRAYTPCVFEAEADVVRALAVVHTELVLIHPFREGNGRVARFLAAAMAMQADYPPLDFGGVRGKQRQAYFAAVRAGLERNYGPMETIFRAVLRRTLRHPGRLFGV